MSTLLFENEIKVVRLSVSLEDFPKRLAEHLQSDPKTIIVEELGADYVARGLPLNETENFVKKVCAWGNYAGVAGKVMKNNDTEFIRSQLKKAHDAIGANQPRTAILEVTRIEGLAVSFGSKHLKFMDPDGAVVLDKIISELLGYRRDPDGYVAFLNDCASIRDVLNAKNVVALSHRPMWRVSDVEMAIFKQLRRENA